MGLIKIFKVGPVPIRRIEMSNKSELRPELEDVVGVAAMGPATPCPDDHVRIATPCNVSPIGYPWNFSDVRVRILPECVYKGIGTAEYDVSVSYDLKTAPAILVTISGECDFAYFNGPLKISTGTHLRRGRLLCS